MLNPVFQRPASLPQLAMPSAVTDAIRPYLRNLIDQIDGPTAAIATDAWWSDLLPADAATIHCSTDLTAGMTVLCVNRLRGLLPVDWLSAAGASVIYAEAAQHHARHFARPRFGPLDVTGTLWTAGLSTIDVHRPVIDAVDGRWELAIGRARPTPRQLIPE